MTAQHSYQQRFFSQRIYVLVRHSGRCIEGIGHCIDRYWHCAVSSFGKNYFI